MPFNKDYYASGRNNHESHSSSSGRETFDGRRYGNGQKAVNGNQYDNHASSMSMKRNDSDFTIQRTVPNKKSNKYNSLDRGGLIEEQEVSPMMMKKKANVHLEPMSHKKAQLLQTGLGPAQADLNMAHSESNPLLQAVINDRVKLEKLNHIPSVKSNLKQSDSLSQSGADPIPAPAGLNYEAMPIGKKSVLAPINVLNS